MAKKHPIGVRLTDEERAALDAAAEGSSLALSAMVRMIVAEWLRRQGWLKEGEEVSCPQTTLDARDVRVKIYAAGRHWTLTMTHIPTGVRVTRSGDGSCYQAEKELLAELAEALGAR